MSSMKLYNYIIKNAAAKNTRRLQFFFILEVKECNNYDKTYSTVMLTSPKTSKLIYFMLLASLYVHRVMQCLNKQL